MPLIPLSSRGGPQTEQEISPVFKDPNVVAAVLANHGAIGVGSTLMKAQYLAEIIEEMRISRLFETLRCWRTQNVQSICQFLEQRKIQERRCSNCV